MKEPDVVLSDYVLGVESLVFAALLAGQSGTRVSLQQSFAILFAATGLAALAGGTVHGFLGSSRSIVGKWLWRATLVSVGTAAAAAWVIGGQLMFDDGWTRPILLAAAVQLLVYSVIVTMVTDAFWLTIANYAPAAIFLTAAFAVSYRRDPSDSLLLGLAGLALTLIAAMLQQARVAIHRTYFSHDALYHVLQAVALLMIFAAARHLVA